MLKFVTMSYRTAELKSLRQHPREVHEALLWKLVAAEILDPKEVPGACLEEHLQEIIVAGKTTAATINAFLDDALATVAAEARAAEHEKLLAPLKHQYTDIESEYKKTSVALELFPKWEEIEAALTPQMYETLNLPKAVLILCHELDVMCPSQRGEKWTVSIAEYNESGTEYLHLFQVLPK